MKFLKVIPSERLRPYIKHFAIAENESVDTYKVFPSTSLVVGFQYQGRLSVINNEDKALLHTAGVTGITDRYKTFSSEAGTGTVLVYFTELGLAFFTPLPLHELFNENIALDSLFNRAKIDETEERLASAATDDERIAVVEYFFMSQLKEKTPDGLVAEAVRLIEQSKGNLRVKILNERLFISASSFEKRFRRWVGTTPKKFASIVRFNAALDLMSSKDMLTQVAYENNYFDQAHFIHDFRRYTGDTPENFRRNAKTAE